MDFYYKQNTGKSIKKIKIWNKFLSSSEQRKNKILGVKYHFEEPDEDRM
jgi:hypothetical protein